MNIFLPIFFAAIAAVGNALFALGQKQSSGVDNGLLFVGGSALIALVLSVLTSPLVGSVDFIILLKYNWKSLLMSGAGLFLTYVGFNLLYSKFGASQYVLYASISIITTSVIVGFFYLKEPMNVYHIGSIMMAIAAVVLFSVGQSKV
jgi:drug/metabolite transporter (DMT)-like permease